MAEPKQPTEIPKLSAFRMDMIKPNSIITFIGKNTNQKAIYKSYGQYFESMSQFKQILDALEDNECLVIDETSPKNRIQDLLFIHSS